MIGQLSEELGVPFFPGRGFSRARLATCRAPRARVVDLDSFQEAQTVLSQSKPSKNEKNCTHSSTGSPVGLTTLQKP